ncbi:helix-turn-helix domain-containing protein [Enterococcus sp. DIV0765f]|uniref:helix-turn-helix domain-containing protein n=1 Tax=Enterococcus sp. DIV0765f TaxID=2774783 RepID=UPI003F68356D
MKKTKKTKNILYIYTIINFNLKNLKKGKYMIEDYIEKDILRQVKIIEYFFDSEHLSLRELSENLNVTSETIRRDFSRIEVVLKDKIKYIEIELSICKIQFLPQYSRYDLVKEIYQDSKFLRICSRYIMGVKDYITIVDEEFVSVSKAFQLRKKVEAFFSQSVYFVDDDKYGEFKFRFLILSIWMRCDLLDEMIDQEHWDTAIRFTDNLLNVFSNHLDKREYIFIVKSVYIMLVHSEKNKLFIPKVAYDYMNSSVIVDKIEYLANSFFEKNIRNMITRHEIIYLAIVFRMVPYNVKNYTLLKMDYEYQRKRLLSSFPNIAQLILSFEQEFNISLLKNIRFEKPLLTLILSSLLETQDFIVDKHYFLSEKKMCLKEKILKIIRTWDKDSNSIQYFLSPDALDRFCVEVFSILMPQSNPYKFIVVVAENDDSHIEYRESISAYISGSNMILDNEMYYSLNDIPSYYENYIIICEHSLLNTSQINKNNIIFPISFNSLDKDLKNIFTKLYFDVG